MGKFLNGLALKFYRGIGPAEQMMNNFQDFNFFIGRNNAGKSIVLNFLSQRLNENKIKDESFEFYRGASTGNICYYVGIPAAEFAANVLDKMDDSGREHASVEVGRVVSRISVDGSVWIRRSENNRRDLEYRKLAPIADVLTAEKWKLLWSILTRQSGGNMERHWIPESLNRMLTAQNLNFPEVKMIPAKRTIGPKDEIFEDLSGRGLIDKLFQFQSPDLQSYEHHREQFAKINRFLKAVTDRADAKIEIPYNRSAILVHMDSKVLPLAALGTGVHEVIMIAAFSTIHEECIMCIEEPEIHLHPILQRKLIRYLHENTNNQYFIATHSPSFIDTPGSAVFHVTNDGSQTYIVGTPLPSEKYKICADLGCRASDILQANAVVWVEGPSDRVYLNKWINMIDASLEEGVNYSIMFYGGRLLSHLSGDVDAVVDLIQLRSLNRNSAIVIDSDKSGPHDRINSTKTRLKDEFLKDGGFCWITQGREIENYVEHTVLQAAVREVYSDVYGAPRQGSAYDHSLHFDRKSLKRRRNTSAHKATLLENKVDKVAVSHAVCSKDVSLDVLDLRKRVTDLVGFIHSAN